jgi:hypothetical protein
MRCKIGGREVELAIESLVRGGVVNTTTSKRRQVGVVEQRDATHSLPRYTEAPGSSELACKQKPVPNPAPSPIIIEALTSGRPRTWRQHI